MLKLSNQIAAYLLLAAFSLDLMGGRWAAYIISPLPGIYLPDFFYLIAIFLIILNIKNLKIWFKNQLLLERYLSLLVLVWVISKLGISYFVHHEKFSYAIRDGAILVFLVSAPLAGIALKSIESEKIKAAIKWSTLIYVVTFIATYLGFITPFNSVILGGSNSVRVFEFGGDLLGVVCGVAYLYWSDTPKNSFINVLPRILAIAPLVVNNSRGGILALAGIVILTIFFIRRDRWKAEIVIITLGLLLGMCMALKPPKSFHGVPVYSTNINFNMQDRGDISPAFGIFKLFTPQLSKSNTEGVRFRQDKIEITGVDEKEFYIPFKFSPEIEEFFQRKGTAVARLATWKILFEYHLRNKLWIAGAPYGSYIMQVACSNPHLPTYGTNYPGGGVKGPKCPVDSNETYSPARDAHNALVTIFIYNGILGLIFFFILLKFQISRLRGIEVGGKACALIALIGYAISGMFSTFALSSFALLPCAFFLAYLSSLGSRNA